MKVRCMKIYDHMTKQYVETSQSLTIGNEYLVLEIDISPEKWVKYRLLDDHESKTSALYNAKDFEIVSNKVSTLWEINQLQTGMITLRPETWTQKGFWESFYDYDLEALKIYRRALIHMMKEEEMLSSDFQDNEEEAFKDYKKPQIVNLKVTKSN